MIPAHVVAVKSTKSVVCGKTRRKDEPGIPETDISPQLLQI